ncbi:MAG: tRNA (adenosine(37)-N6)-threonylcarbamoyltransferase complex ATPase subunit type 1 TsaE [Gammaproteobacteria bacterium]
MQILPIPDTEAMLTLGHKLAQRSITECVIFLQGPLGAGKTTLIRGLLQGLGYNSAVKSPTYTLVETYALAAHTIYHWDMYRIVEPEELEFMGIRDYAQQPAWWLVEWPEKVNEMLPKPDLNISIQVEGTGRVVTLEAFTEIGNLLCQNCL